MLVDPNAKVSICLKDSQPPIFLVVHVYWIIEQKAKKSQRQMFQIKRTRNKGDTKSILKKEYFVFFDIFMRIKKKVQKFLGIIKRTTNA
jgi:hypothetical protein